MAKSRKKAPDLTPRRPPRDDEDEAGSALKGREIALTADPNRKRLQVMVPKTIIRRLKILAMDHETTMSDIVEEILTREVPKLEGEA